MDLIGNKKRVVLDNFLHAEFRFSFIRANRCELFKNAGFILYLGDEIVMHSVANKPIQAQLVKSPGDREHYCVKTLSSDGRDEFLYLVTSGPKLDSRGFQVGQAVIRVDDNTAHTVFSAFYRFSASPDAEIAKFLESRKHEFEWKINKIIADRFCEIQKDGEVAYAALGDVTTYEKLKSEAEEFKTLFQKKK